MRLNKLTQVITHVNAPIAATKFEKLAELLTK
jgi:hypothetical protein